MVLNGHECLRAQRARAAIPKKRALPLLPPPIYWPPPRSRDALEMIPVNSRLTLPQSDLHHGSAWMSHLSQRRVAAAHSATSPDQNPGPVWHLAPVRAAPPG